MTTVQITLPDDLVQTAVSAGLLSRTTMEAMLREQLRAMWQRMPSGDFTSEIEQASVEVVRKVRAERRTCGVG